MAEEESLQERTEEPSGRRLAEARLEGQVARSQEITSFVAIVSAVAALMMWGPAIGQDILRSMEAALRMIAMHDPVLVLPWVKTYVQPLMFSLLSMVAFVMGLGILSNVAQVGVLLAWKSVRPKMEKINPQKGLAKLLSMQTLVQFVKNVLKVIVIFWIVYVNLRDDMDAIVGLSALAFGEALRWLFTSLGTVILKISVFLAVVAVLDYLYQWFSLRKKMMMTRQEVKEELKQSQVSEHVHKKMRQVAGERAKQTIKKEVPTADVVVTNPTHYAVALKYERGVDVAPRVVAKGQDHLAAFIRVLAEEHNVPLYESPPLARQLYKRVRVGQAISQDLFEAVARVLAFVYRLHHKHEARQAELR